MAQAQTVKLDNGSVFPETRLQLAGGSTVMIPNDFKDSWTVLLVYRGHW